MDGVRAACEAYKVDLVGGDTTSSGAGLVLSVTAIGDALPEQIVRRSGAQKGDILCATGDLGAAYLGLQVLLREKEAFKANPDMQPNLEDYQYLVGRQLRPQARMDIIHDLRDLGVVPTSMMDISDGLASEIMHLSRASGVGIVIYEKNLPYTEELNRVAVDEFKIDPITCVLNGGEDYELVFTVKQADHDKIKNHPDINLIGYVADADREQIMVTKGEQIVPLKAQGWDHLK
ncbi:MAG TPA: thiamine-phosphate kinase, partial [Cytophagales bacterium]|nr:thiamine-phosphate kinase [Cytophagales bacterium]